MQINRYFDLKVKEDTDCWHNASNKLHDMIWSIKNDLYQTGAHEAISTEKWDNLSHIKHSSQNTRNV